MQPSFNPENPAESAWQPQPLRFPRAEEPLSPEEGQAQRAWASRLCDALSDQSFEFRCAPDGTLQTRPRDPRPQAKRIYSSPASVCRRLRGLFLELALTPPPPEVLAYPTPAQEGAAPMSP